MSINSPLQIYRRPHIRFTVDGWVRVLLRAAFVLAGSSVGEGAAAAGCGACLLRAGDWGEHLFVQPALRLELLFPSFMCSFVAACSVSGCWWLLLGFWFRSGQVVRCFYNVLWSPSFLGTASRFIFSRTSLSYLCPTERLSEPLQHGAPGALCDVSPPDARRVCILDPWCILGVLIYVKEDYFGD